MCFHKNNSILRPFEVKFRFNGHVFRIANPTQNKHKNNLKAQVICLAILPLATERN